MRWDDIPGWTDFAATYVAAVERLADGDVIAEVGCWVGKSTALMADLIRHSGKRITFWAIDPGFGSSGDADLHSPTIIECGGNTTGRLLVNLRDCGVFDHVCPLAVPSVRAAKLFPDESLSFLFIDGDHAEEAVTADLCAWWDKIRVGGVIAGHDYEGYYPGGKNPVKTAVDRFFGRSVPDPHTPTCWSVTKEV